MTFDQFRIAPQIQRGISGLGFTEPTPIQRAAIPPALEGRDILACAMTGSGKTAAFVLPILERLSRSTTRGVRALVLTPTRELAAQIHEHLTSLGRHTPITAATVFGGVKPAAQERALRAGVNVVVATPGRLLDLMRHPWARFDRLEVLVLDEADRMLDMGFLPDVRRIVERLPGRRQTMLFSATMPRPIVELSRSMLVNPERLNIERKSKPASGISHAVLPVPEKLKPALLLQLLLKGEVETALVFTRTKHRANRLQRYLERSGVTCDRIHGNRSQPQRQAALAAFKDGRLRVLVATDIAARGIDVESLPHVVNFDIPIQADDYIHRVGRTARASATGTALTFVSPTDGRELAAIERAMGSRIEQRRVTGFDYKAVPEAPFEVPIKQRIAEIRTRRAEERARARAKAALREQRAAEQEHGSADLGPKRGQRRPRPATAPTGAHGHRRRGRRTERAAQNRS